MTRFSDYIVYVDESGDHGLNTINPLYPMFVLAFCIFRKDVYRNDAVPAMQRLKFEHFGHDMVVFHERDIRKATGDFRFLTNTRHREGFMADLTQLISDMPMTLIASAIKKLDLTKQYVTPQNPYNIALHFALERLLFFLKAHDHTGRVTHVIFESRGRKEDSQLELVFRRILDGRSVSAKAGTLEILFANKQANSCGLQIADLVARPIGRKLLDPDQPNRAFDTLRTKFRTSPAGKIEGWGLKVFP